MADITEKTGNGELVANCDLKRIVVILRTKVVLLAFKLLSHKPFLGKERKINSFIAVIVVLLT